MKINQFLAFKPVTITFETEAELAFFVRAMGSYTENIISAFDIDTEQHTINYNAIYEEIGFDAMEKYPKLNYLVYSKFDALEKYPNPELNFLILAKINSNI
jgi:hypothetical protein